MTTLPESFRRLRRQCLIGAAGAALGLPALAGRAEPARAGRATPSPALRVAQLLDTSAEEQDVSRDYAAGVQLALAQAARNERQALQVVTLSCDGSPESLRSALRQLQDDPSLVAVLGTAGERLALDSIAAARQEGLDIAHIAPWLADSRHDAATEVVSLFASRQAQIDHALKSLQAVGVKEIGLVYASERQRESLHGSLSQGVAAAGLKVVAFAPATGTDVTGLAAALPAAAPALLLFLGGTIELGRFAQGLAARRVERYLVSFSDIALPTLRQLGMSRSVPLIVTQVVPNPQSSQLPAVQDYRAALKQLLDEEPSHVSLAGYLAGRYALQSLRGLDGAPSRASVLAHFRRRPSGVIGGFEFGFRGASGRGTGFVTQSLLAGDGRLIG